MGTQKAVLEPIAEESSECANEKPKSDDSPTTRPVSPPRDQDDQEEDLCSQASQSSSQGGDELPEESMLCAYEDMSSQIPEALRDQQDHNTQQSNDLHGDVIKFIQNDPELHRQCLTYEPIWLEKFFDSFKAWSGLSSRQLKITQVMDILDNECITFRNMPRKPRKPK